MLRVTSQAAPIASSVAAAPSASITVRASL